MTTVFTNTPISYYRRFDWGCAMKIDETIVDRVEKAMDEYHRRFEGFFQRSEPREQSRKYLHALVTAPDRRNGWELAESSGDSLPDPTQRLLYRSHWDADAVRDEHIRFAIEHIGEEDGTFISDETGFLKTGKSSAGVQRQYTGTAGKITNCQIGGFLGYTSPTGSMLLDRALYMPKAWFEDPARCKKAQVPPDLRFATKPAQALKMLQHAVSALRVPGRWVVADEVYGNCPDYRTGVASLGLTYVAAVNRTTKVGKPASKQKEGRPVLSFWPAREEMSVELIARNLPAGEWEALATKAGERCPIKYWWAAVRVMMMGTEEGWLLIRRSMTDRDDLAFYFSNAGPDETLKTLATVALRRAAIEQCFAEAKTEAGLDEYEVRLWGAWYRHITLAMMAHAFLVATKKTLRDAILHIRAARAGRGQVRSDPPFRTRHKGVLSDVAKVQGREKAHGARRSLQKSLLSREAK